MRHLVSVLACTLLLLSDCAAGQIRTSLEELQDVIGDQQLAAAVTDLVTSEYSDTKWVCQALIVVSSVVDLVPMDAEHRMIADSILETSRAMCPWVIDVITSVRSPAS